MKSSGRLETKSAAFCICACFTRKSSANLANYYYGGNKAWISRRFYDKLMMQNRQREKQAAVCADAGGVRKGSKQQVAGQEQVAKRIVNADKHSPASSARSTKRWVQGGCLCQWELKAPTDRSRSDCVHEQVAKRIANVRFTRKERWADCINKDSK